MQFTAHELKEQLLRAIDADNNVRNSPQNAEKREKLVDCENSHRKTQNYAQSREFGPLRMEMS